MSHRRYGFIDGWLRHIKDVYRFNEKELDAIPDEQARFDRLVELNVIEQVNNLAKVSFIQEEWENNEFPYIHGWVYDLHTGKIKELDCTVNNADLIEGVYHYDL